MDRNVSIENLSKLIIFSKYAKYDPEKKRRETWDEICDRAMQMHINKFPKFKDEITNAFDFVKDKKVVPSLRSLQFGGRPIELNNSRIYNCSAMAIKKPKDFAEICFLLMSGAGVGISVQNRHISQLPPIQKPTKTRKFVIGDSIEGWSDSIRALFKCYFKGGTRPLFDYSDIREKGAMLITAGGKAPGPEPLRRCINKIESILERKENGEKLKTVDVFDIVCHIADCVLSGGIRRAAILTLFDKDDMEMLNSKGNFPVDVINGGFHLNPSTNSYDGEVFYKNKAHFISLDEYSFQEFSKNKTLPWYYFEPQRARSNNSVVLKRDATTKEEFEYIFNKTKGSGAGEPGFFWTNNYEYLTNPCGEISLASGNSFCNLTEINVSTLKSQKDLLERVKVATILGTLQATYTDFHYLSKEWQDNTEKDALLGVSLTGIADIDYTKFDWLEAANYARLINEEWAEKLGINTASRICCVKPSGTASLCLGTASGIHSRYAEFYKRNIRYNKNEPIAEYLMKYHPEVVNDEIGNPSTIVVTIPIKSPKTSIMRTETSLDFLERIKYFSDTWIAGGHITGDNKHNISCTVNVKPEEWNEVSEWMWKNRETYNGISLIPYDNGSYTQPPHEEINEKEYNKLARNLKDFDFTKVIEENDNTNLKGIVACGGNQCELV